MTENPNRENVVSYYDEHVKNKLNDYIVVNPRIELGWETIKRFTTKPKRILEVGCGMGNICSRMHKYWPDAVITGIDISTLSIQVAQKLFADNKLDFRESILTKDTFDEQFDLIIFMDVYEHIAVVDRPEVHAALAKILSNKGRIVLTVPTPHNLKWSLVNKPETMQPVDEHISFETVGKLAADIGAEVILYESKSVWNVGDYAHIVLEKNDDFEAAFFYPKPVTSSQRAKRIINKAINKFSSVFRRFYVKRKLG
ncbi:methyltransferase domain-containing protein [Mucilaginibacter rubeus]|uniref:Methyltransferase domain-containing protein n=1 Tax=Mucilaginibacter rubeus TaxID=2027860 RepID=A0AAE6JKM5_9SPHI|nr:MULTISPECIES: class I SAM-dependent methyltransferase [Mucilaginibacter]QEM06347.1 methyltransferase domain-containing protein [Mucilaginibacter rubeus]QEM18930.1 methyltransferase domain-containing protein [Mucilaginibacter gossypii]QTE36083.1 methyltransferase domain-containing protein [Mucilaginibacter gossypii]QTE44528.1 methyltransferase domain-containing protein [Mucilaginibacter rubeus]QTE51126.1 methyltransferase domain-containing protein [Mucilaginibacter rubeus]